MGMDMVGPDEGVRTRRREVVARGSVDDATAPEAFLMFYEDTHPLFRAEGVTHGYRKIGLPFWAVLRSGFRLHNETINIWSHLLAGIFFVGVLVWTLMFHSEWELKIIMTIYCCGAAMCFFASSVFHWFSVLSLRAYRHMKLLDLTGIQSFISASYVPPMYYLFRCRPSLRVLYMSIVVVTFLVSIGYTPHLDAKGKFMSRNLVFSVVSAWGIIPTIHYAFMGEPNYDQIIVMQLGVFALYGLGFLVYTLRVPERWIHGKCNLLGHSHQWWHIFVVLAAVSWLVSIFRFHNMEWGFCAANLT